jgi:hypothetical protein
MPATETKLSTAQAALMKDLCNCDPGKGLLLSKEDRRIAAPLLNKGLVMWLGFGNVRVYSATDEGRAAFAKEPA